MKLANNELEQRLLASLIMFPEIMNKYASKIDLAIFYSALHRRIFEIIQTLFHNNQKYDLVIISHELEKQNIDSKYLVAIIHLADTSSNIERYIYYLVELGVKRDFLYKFQNLINIASNPESDIFELRDNCFTTFNELFIDKFLESTKATLEFPELIDLIENRYERINSGVEPGIPSSTNMIMKAMGGWQKSNLSIVAARPGMGKTSFMVQQIVDCVAHKYNVGIFSLEMSAEQIAAKLTTNITSIPNHFFLRKGLNEEQIERFRSFKDTLKSLPIFIDDTPGLTISELRIKTKLLKMRFDIDILFIDYLQLIRNPKSANKEQETSEVSAGLKAIAKEFDIPVIALSQLSRAVETRGGSKRPVLSDLRHSGSIEQDADEVLFMYRPEYYNITTWDEEYNFEPTDNEVEVILAKNRHGGLLSERLKTNLTTSTFQNL